VALPVLLRRPSSQSARMRPRASTASKNNVIRYRKRRKDYRPRVRAAHTKSHDIAGGRQTVGRPAAGLSPGNFANPASVDGLIRISTNAGDFLDDEIGRSRVQSNMRNGQLAESGRSDEDREYHIIASGQVEHESEQGWCDQHRAKDGNTERAISPTITP